MHRETRNTGWVLIGYRKQRSSVEITMTAAIDDQADSLLALSAQV